MRSPSPFLHWAQLLQGTGYLYSNGNGTAALSTPTAGLSTVSVTGSTQAIAVSTSYINNPSSARCVYTLPSTAAVGDRFEIVGKSDTYGWQIAQNASQTIQYGNLTTTAGTSDGLLGVDTRAVVQIVCVTANLAFEVTSFVGAISSLNPTGYAEGGIGAVAPTTTIEAFAFATETDSVIGQTMVVARQQAAGCCSTTKGYAIGGYNGTLSQTAIEALTFVTQSAAALSAVLTTATREFGQEGLGSSTKGYTAGGSTTAASATAIATINTLTYSVESAAVAAGTLGTARNLPCGVSSSTKGYVMGGTNAAGSNTAIIDAITWSNDSDAVLAATLDTARNGSCGVNSATKGYAMGGIPATTVIEDINFSNDTSAAISATLSATLSYGAGVNNATYGYELGAYNGTTYVTTINRFVFSGETCGSIGAVLTTARYAATAFQTGGFL